MLKIFLIPELKELTEFDVGFHLPKIRAIDAEIATMEQTKRGTPWKDWKIWNAKIDKLKKLRLERIELAKQTIALVNKKEKALLAIKYYVVNNDKYQKCEFDILRAKK